MNKIKDLIIYHVLEYIEFKKENSKKIAIENIKIFAKHYHVQLKTKTKHNLYKSLKEFIINTDGYNNSVLKLYNAII